MATALEIVALHNMKSRDGRRHDDRDNVSGIAVWGGHKNLNPSISFGLNPKPGFGGRV